MHVREHDEPRKRGAFLSAVTERAVKGGGDGFIEVGVVVDDERVLAPPFAHHLFEVGLSRKRPPGRLPDLAADGARAGEGDGIDLRMGGEESADLRTDARQVIQHARRHARLHEQVHQHGADDAPSPPA